MVEIVMKYDANGNIPTLFVVCADRCPNVYDFGRLCL